MYGYESWSIKKAEHWRINAFELWCWRRLLRIPWTARRSNQSILKEINPEYSLEGLIVKLKLQYFGHLMRKTVSLKRPGCWEQLKAGGEGENRGQDGWMVWPTQWTRVLASSGSWWWTAKPGVLQSMGSHRTEQLNWSWHIIITRWFPFIVCSVMRLFSELLQPLFSRIFCCSVTQSCLTLCNSMDCSTPGFPVFSWLQSPSVVILEPKKIASHCLHCFPIYLPWRDTRLIFFLASIHWFSVFM